MELDKYERRIKSNVSEDTVEVRLSALRVLDRFISSDEPDVEDVEKWIDSLIEKKDNGEIKSSTIREYFKAVKNYFNVMLGGSDELNHIGDWLPTKNVDHGDYLTFEEWERYKKAIHHPRDKAMIYTMYFYARRPGEVIGLNMSDIDMDEGTIQFEILKKDEEFRATFDLLPKVESAIDEYLDYRNEQVEMMEDDDGNVTDVRPLFTTAQGRIVNETLNKRMKDIAKRANIDKNITPKTMRHIRATHLDWKGEEPGKIARHQLVHGPDTDVISSYIHDREEDDVREVMQIDEEE